MTEVRRPCLGHHYSADAALAERVVNATISDETRSEWRWFVTEDGDVIFGCFPRGDLYEELMNGRGRTIEHDRQQAYTRGTVRYLHAESVGTVAYGEVGVTAHDYQPAED